MRKRIFNNSEDKQAAQYQDVIFVFGICIIESSSILHIGILKLVSIADIYNTTNDRKAPSDINQRLSQWQKKQIQKYHKENVDTTSILSSISGIILDIWQELINLYGCEIIIILYTFHWLNLFLLRYVCCFFSL